MIPVAGARTTILIRSNRIGVGYMGLEDGLKEPYIVHDAGHVHVSLLDGYEWDKRDLVLASHISFPVF